MKITLEGKIVGYTQGSTFSSDEIRAIKSGMRNFHFQMNFCMVEGDEPICHTDDIVVKATDFKTAKESLGYGSSYEEEWGDYAVFLKALKEKDEALLVFERKIQDIEIVSKEW